MAKCKKVNTKKLTAMFKALSNSTRLEIFLHLASPSQRDPLHNERPRIFIGLIAKNLGIVPSTASHHIKQLHNAGLIHMKRRGQNIDCWINSENLEFLEQFFTEIHQKLINK